MESNYAKQAACFKALSDETRLQILEMLTMGELCACKILEKFQFTQPTLSYHMKTLTSAGLVKGRKEGKWTYYSLEEDALERAGRYFRQLLEAIPEQRCVLCGKNRKDWEKENGNCCDEIMKEELPMETSKKIKLYVLTGFLGSGKTSMLLKILDNLAGHKVGILQNEFGRIDVDSEILKRDGLVMTELTRGSIFCTCLQLKFTEALAKMSQENIEYLFVESSGLADPSNLDEILEAVKVLAGDVYEMSGMICLVDAVNFLEQVEDEITVDRQLKHCNRAVVNKVDLVSEEQLADVIATVRKYNPICDIDTTTFGDIGTTFLEQNLMEKKWAESEKTTNSVDTKPKTMSLNFDGIAPKEKLEAFLKEILPLAYRIKGFFQLDNGWQQVDVVGKNIDYKPCEAKEESHLVFISKVGPQIIRPIDQKWKDIVGLPMKLKN